MWNKGNIRCLSNHFDNGRINMQRHVSDWFWVNLSFPPCLHLRMVIQGWLLLIQWPQCFTFGMRLNSALFACVKKVDGCWWLWVAKAGLRFPCTQLKMVKGAAYAPKHNCVRWSVYKSCLLCARWNVWVCACSPMWLLSEGSDWWWGMERIRNTLGCEWGVSRRVTLAQNTAASHIITLITLMRTTLRATKRLDSWRLA